MDTIGLLAAWVAVLSLLLAIGFVSVVSLFLPAVQRWWAKTSVSRTTRRIDWLEREMSETQRMANSYTPQLVALYGSAILTSIAASAVVIVSILFMDLGPALLAAVLPFNIESKLLTRCAGILLFFASYVFLFRICYLAVKIRLKTLPIQPGFTERAMKEIASLRARSGSLIERR